LTPVPSPKLAAGGAAAELKPPPMPTPQGSPAPVRADDQPTGKFDPEGRSAVSGQKRTGWI
jgi:hypothetical protein